MYEYNKYMYIIAGHVISEKNLLPISLARGSSGRELDFTYQLRDQPSMVSMLHLHQVAVKSTGYASCVSRTVQSICSQTCKFVKLKINYCQSVAIYSMHPCTRVAYLASKGVAYETCTCMHM